MTTANSRFLPSGLLIRRVRSCHGSDCPSGPHRFARNRCVVVTRIDDTRNKVSRWVVRGDRAERSGAKGADWSPSLYAKPLTYGGGFWCRVEIPAPGF